MQSVLTIPVFSQPLTEGLVEGQPVAASGEFLLSFVEGPEPTAEEPARVADAPIVPVPATLWVPPIPLALPLTPMTQSGAEGEVADFPGQSVVEGVALAAPLV
ncbi:MAG: hypothetical protein JNK19_12870, partial [Tabrizicola sp.]|nr:hypothetical protein [Tabrizicola sp.]